jgi:putative salt-induced outer membrane protein YdiY
MSLRAHLLAGVVLLSPVTAFAQAAAPPPPPPKHEVSGEVAYVGVSGNASSNTFGIRFETVHRPAPWLIRQRLAFVRNESDGALTAEAFSYTPRVERVINPRTSAFGEYQYFRDEFAGVEHRNTVNGGLSIKLITQERQTLSADVGIGYLNEQRLTGDDVSSAIYSAGTSYRLKLSETSELADDLGFVGTFARAEDWRLMHTIAITAKLTDIFSLKASNNIRYSNFPAPGFEKTDVITSVALVLTLKRP